ncbi:MAG: acyl-ACP--UDP-N-acetylglucosamine O-acyltransferase [Kiritimatiellia bacterium]
MSNIHSTAIIQPGAQIDEGVAIGPYCVIGPHVKIGAGTVLQSHVVVDGHTTIGRDCQLFPFACIGMKTQDLKFAGGTTYAEIGDQTVLREFSTVHTGTKEGEVTRIGRKCLIMAYCHVAHGCVVGNEVIMSNSSQLAGEAKVEDSAIIAGMVGVHQFCRIGTLAMIGGATKVRQDCPPYMITEGEQATVIGPNIVGLQRHGIPQETRSALKEAFRLIYREGLNRSQAMERIKYEVPDLPEVRHLVEFYQQSTRGVA